MACSNVSTAVRIVLAQGLLGLTCSLGFYFLSAAAGKSALLAFLAVLAPSAYYAWIVRRTFNATRLLLHGVLKSLLTLVGIALSIAYFGVEPLAFFVTFAVMQVSYVMGGESSHENKKRVG
jgi:F0F1-type ATP synthase assembly protein I